MAVPWQQGFTAFAAVALERAFEDVAQLNQLDFLGLIAFVLPVTTHFADSYLLTSFFATDFVVNIVDTSLVAKHMRTHTGGIDGCTPPLIRPLRHLIEEGNSNFQPEESAYEIGWLLADS